jgi:hypothetical protein
VVLLDGCNIREGKNMFRKSLIALLVMCFAGSVLYGVALGSEGYLFQKELLLDARGKDCVMAGRMKFEVTASTVIENGNGIKITIEELSVPREAVIKYYEKSDRSGAHVAVSIQEKLIPE